MQVNLVFPLNCILLEKITICKILGTEDAVEGNLCLTLTVPKLVNGERSGGVATEKRNTGAECPAEVRIWPHCKAHLGAGSGKGNWALVATQPRWSGCPFELLLDHCPRLPPGRRVPAAHPHTGWDPGPAWSSCACSCGKLRKVFWNACLSLCN